MGDNRKITTDAKKARFLEYFKDLPVQKLAAGYAGVDEDTVTNWKKDDQKFSDQVGILKSEWAKKTSSQVRSKEWLLERIMKDHFAERKEVTGAEGKPVIPLIPLENNNVQSNDSTTEDPATEKEN